MLEQNEEESVRRLSNRQIDPDTGDYYNVEIVPAPDDIAGRLLPLEQDKEPTVRAKFKGFREFLPSLEEAFRQEVITM